MKLNIDIGSKQFIFEFKSLLMFKKGIRDFKSNNRGNKYLFTKTSKYNCDWISGWLYGKFIYSYHCPMFISIGD